MSHLFQVIETKLLCISSTLSFYQTTEQLSLDAAHSVLVSEALDLKLKAVVSAVEPVNGQQCICSLQRCLVWGRGTLWDPHAVRSAASSHHSTVRLLDLGRICRFADWSLSSGAYHKFYSRYV